MSPLNVRFNSQMRVDTAWRDRNRTQADMEMLGLLRRGGADVTYIGYETVDEGLAASWNKGYAGSDTLRKRLMQDTQMLHDHGMWIHGMFVLGPQQDRRAAMEIVDFAQGRPHREHSDQPADAPAGNAAV